MTGRSDDETPGPGPVFGLEGAPTSEGAAARRDHRPGREPGDLAVALSPRQIIGGFAMLAALILMLKRRGRRKGQDKG